MPPQLLYGGFWRLKALSWLLVSATFGSRFITCLFGAACAAGGRWRAAGEGLAFGRDFYRPAGAGAFSLLFIWAACAAGGGRWRRGLVLWDEIFIGLRARGFFAALYLGRLRGGRQMGAC